MNYKRQIEELRQYARMETEYDMKMFEFVSSKFLLNKDAKILEELIDIFDDNCQDHEIMHNLVQVVENYPNDIYIKTLLKKVKNCFKYIDWFTLLLYHIFNSEIHLELFKENIYLADRNKLLELLEIMYQESEAHRPIIDELRKLIEKGDNDRIS